MDAAGVVRLARKLRRDKVTVSGGSHRVGQQIVRYHLSDGRSADQHDARLGRYLDDYRYAMHGHRKFSSLDLAKIGDLTDTSVDWLITGRQPPRWKRLRRTAIRLGWRVRPLWWRVTDRRTRSS